VLSARPAEEPFPGGFEKPTSVIISGASRSLLKWFAFAALAPYSARVHWTDVRLPGEVLDPLDPISLRAIPPETVDVRLPRELAPDDQGARQAEAAAATVLRSDEPNSSLHGVVEFLRMPDHAQKLIAASGRDPAPLILVTANSHRLASVYSEDRVGPLLRALKESGTCQVALWAEAPTTYASLFDVVLHLEGNSPAEWQNASIRCEKGISTGPFASRTPRRLSDIAPIATILGRSIPAPAR
jgi:hypothetical protein